MTDRPRIVPLEERHLDAVAALNDAEVPRVSPLGRTGLDDLRPRCDLTVVAEEPDGSLAGFLLAVAPGMDYVSVNYRWFDDRRDDFLYIDRVVVAPTHRRRGVAASLYEAVEHRARATGRRQITCEVNVRPPNAGSLAFHRSRGFLEVGRQDTSDGRLTVALLSLPLSAEPDLDR